MSKYVSSAMLRVTIMLLITAIVQLYVDSDKMQKDSTYNSTYITKDGQNVAETYNLDSFTQKS